MTGAAPLLGSAIRAPTQREVLAAILRTDLYAFVQKCFHWKHGKPMEESWHIQAMCHAVEEVWRGHDRRLMINIPPRYLKSETISVAFTAWALGQNPKLKIIVATYAAALSSELANAFRRIVTSSWYQELFPGMRLETSTTLLQETTEGGSRRAVSVEGASTGFGADIIICDDLMKAGDASSQAVLQRVRDFYDTVLISRLNDKPIGSVIVLQQRIHPDDFAAHALQKGIFKTLILPAIAMQDETILLGHGRVYQRSAGGVLHPAREPLETLEQMRLEMGDQVFAAQYQQSPESAESHYLRWEWLQFYDEMPAREDVLRVYQCWDTATGTSGISDWSVGITVGLLASGDWVILDLYRGRLAYPDLKAKVLELRRHWRPDQVLIEEDHIGRALCAELNRSEVSRNRANGGEASRFYSGVKTGDKIERLIAQGAKIRDGLIKFPRGAVWLPDLRREMQTVGTGGGHDDMLDSIAHFCATMINTRRGNAVRDAALSGLPAAGAARPDFVRRDFVRRQSVRR